MLGNRLELRHHGRVLLIAPHSQFCGCIMQDGLRNCFVRDTHSAERKLKQFITNTDNERRLKSFWSRFGPPSSRVLRVERFVPEIARRFTIMEIADERGVSEPHREVVQIGSLEKPIPSMNFPEKTALVFQQMPQHLPVALRSSVSNLVTPAAIGMTVGGVVAVIMGGPVVQSLLLAVGFALVGWSIFSAIGNIIDFVAMTRNATTEADIDQAAKKLAGAAADLSIGTLMALLTRGAGRAVASGKVRKPRQAPERQAEADVPSQPQRALPITSPSKQDLIDELSQKGIKHTPQDIVDIRKVPIERIVFLEKGNQSAGLGHILNHADDFSRKGISNRDLPKFIMDNLEKGKIVGYQGKGKGRPIYELIYNGEKYHTAITTGSNGYVVGANPVSLK